MKRVTLVLNRIHFYAMNGVCMHVRRKIGFLYL